MVNSIQLIVGLGNPGSNYVETRHNVGAWLVEALAKQYETTLNLKTKFHGLYAEIKNSDHEYKLLFPNTFMNLSGQAVKAVADFYKIPTAAILIAHDDLDFPAGTIRLHFNGGHGGHKGLKDIISYLDDKNFYRLRIGIGHPGDKNKVHDYVLAKPDVSEKEKIMRSIEKAISIVPELLRGDIDKAQRDLHDGI